MARTRSTADRRDSSSWRDWRFEFPLTTAVVVAPCGARTRLWLRDRRRQRVGMAHSTVRFMVAGKRVYAVASNLGAGVADFLIRGVDCAASKAWDVGRRKGGPLQE